MPPDLTRPSSAYRRHAYLAVAALVAFLAAYLALIAWFSWTAYKLYERLAADRTDSVYLTAVGMGSAAFLAVFMAKALVFVKRSSRPPLEITAKEYPRLFAFIEQLAKDTGAPRPKHVYLSPDVNAAVFYDLSVLNFILPGRKNLLIGLGLVNVLTLSELKAVLAHELGHFAQRSMKVGRWVYMAQQVAAHLVGRRDALDRFLQWLCSIDLRVAWIGYVLRLIVWSIRSLVETVFGWVIMLERALSREMEYQADLVAVSVTGSDALVHGLAKTAAADDGFERAARFALNHERRVEDVFAIQTWMIERKRHILSDPMWGAVPPVPAEPGKHRVFEARLAHPPKMWATHPPSELREENAKRTYVPSSLDDRPAWGLFEDPAAVRRRVTTAMYEAAAAAADDGDERDALAKQSLQPRLETAEAFEELEEAFSRRTLDPMYRGRYLDYPIAQHVAAVRELYDDAALAEPPGRTTSTSDLYPEQLGAWLTELDTLTAEHAQLEAIHEGRASMTGRTVRFRGEEHRRKDLRGLTSRLDGELRELRASVARHDRRLRSVHVAAARQLGAVAEGWEAYLRGLLALVHYAEHAHANVDDAAGAFGNAFAVVIADGKISEAERDRLIAEGEALHHTLAKVYDEAAAVKVGPVIAAKLEIDDWAAALGRYGFGTPTAANLASWMSAVSSWIQGTVVPLRRLVNEARNELIRAEAEVLRLAATGQARDEAPPAPEVPARYATLLPGQERPRQTRLGWWDRFQTADGVVPGLARLAVAGAIVGTIIWAGRAA